MTWIYCDMDDAAANHQGKYFWILTFEGCYAAGDDPTALTKWGSYAGTLDIERGEDDLNVLSNVKLWFEERYGIRVNKVLFWQLKKSHRCWIRKGPNRYPLTLSQRMKALAKAGKEEQKNPLPPQESL